MTIRVGINGFGRIGRLSLRAGWDSSQIEIVHINEPYIGLQGAAHLLEFDSVHGRWDLSATAENGKIQVGDRPLTFSECENLSDVPWKEAEVDIVLECSGKFRKMELLNPYLEQGVRKVIVSAPVSKGSLNIVMGCNEHLYDPEQNHIITAASCTTNCLAPVIKVIHQGIGIEHGLVTTIHDVTNTQVVIDSAHKDLRRARSAIQSLVPTTTGSATAITAIYPELTGKLNGVAVRVPLLNASLTDAVLQVQRKTTVAEVNELFKKASEEGDLAGILGYEERPLVSVDYVNDPRSSIIDAKSTMVVDDTLVKVFAWYDNEWGYSNRMVDLATYIAQFLR